MAKIFLISGVIVFGSMWLLLRYFSKHPDFLSKPKEEQLKTKKQLYLGLYGAIALSAVSYLLLISKSTGWMPWLILAAYLLLWIGGGYLLWSAYLVGIRKDTGKMNKSNGVPFKNPQRFMNAVAMTNLLCGLALWMVAIAIPVFKIGLANWAPMVVGIGVARQFLSLKYEKADNA